MRVYVSGGAIDKANIRFHIARLRAEGVFVEKDWTLLDELTKGTCDAIADAIRRADIFWLVVPAYRSAISAWWEFGFACGLGKLTVVSGELTSSDHSMFVHQASVMYSSHEQALNAIVEKHRLRTGRQ